jgi:phospholipase C
MQGFIERQSDMYNATPGDSSFVIKAYSEENSKMLATMAQSFAFFDSYHAEHPGPTEPNRQFATSGSTCGMVDNTYQSYTVGTKNGTTCTKSIFELLSEKNITWKNYYETDWADANLYKWVQDNAVDQIVPSNQFYSDLANGTLPTFSYINPECCVVDSMHPKSNIAAGEMMLKHLYDSVRNSQYWDNVLIVINFDEHGGFADHVLPPTNVPPPQDNITFSGLSDKQQVSYDFTRLGVRVPAFMISPFLAPNTLIHDQGTSYSNGTKYSESAYTHTSFLHFFQQLFELGEFNNRVAWAKTFEIVFLTEARTDHVELPTPVWHGGVGKPEPDAFYLLNQPLAYYNNLRKQGVVAF